MPPSSVLSFSDSREVTPLKLPQTPSMPLFALSPERANNRGPPMTPSLPDLTNNKPIFSPSEFGAPETSPRSPTTPKNNLSFFDRRSSPPKTPSDVQSMVARFNNLDIKDHVELRKKDAAALKRAQIGREEAETALKRTREESRRLKEDLDESRDRERKVSKRLDAVMEDLHRAKESQQHAQSLYEKEIRKARKEAFKSGSAVVKLQEELKAARAQLKVLHSDLEMEKMKSGRRDQEAFTAQYELVGVQEKLAQAESRVKVVEEERDALKTNLKEEEVARIAAEGRIALPIGSDHEDEFASPKKSRPRRELDHVEIAKTAMELNDIREQLHNESLARLKAEEQIEFMKLECQFGCCSCRLAESHGTRFVHDALSRTSSSLSRTTSNSNSIHEIMEVDHEVPVASEAPPSYTESESHAVRESTPVSHGKRSQRPSLLPAFGDEPAAHRTSSSSIHHAMEENRESIRAMRQVSYSPRQSLQHEQEERALNPRRTRQPSAQAQQPQYTQEPPQSPEQIVESTTPAGSTTPVHTQFRTVTTTTTVPLAPSTPAAGRTVADQSWATTPGMMNLTREEAMEQIRQRRGRARSIAGTPKRAASQNRAQTPRRDISAPAKTPRTASRRAAK